MSAFGSAFGQPSSAFADPASSTFGAPSAFGQSSQAAFGSSAFGAPSGGLFGQSAQQPQNSGFGAFGQSAAAPFGSSVFGASAAQSAPAFGASGAFGGAAFGSSQPSGFGASGAFGASSQPAFGSGGGAFGASGGSSLFGNSRPPTGGFGAAGSGFGQSQSTWGAAASSAAFGASGAFGAPSGGGGIFGTSGAGSSLFGNQNKPAFGAANQSQMGTAGTNWQVTVEYDGGNPASSSRYHAISMMPQFRDRSLEELRYEDYAMGNKGDNTPGSGGSSIFGQSAPGTGLFGSASAFGNSSGGGGFGASAPAFAQQSQGGGFGSSQGGLFGGSTGFGNTGAFGQSSAGGFGSSGGAFGQSGGAVFGKPAAASGFGQSGGAAFGAGASAFGTGATGFGGGAAGFGSSGTAFGSGATGFGAGGGGFGSGTGGFGSGAAGFGAGASGFGASGFGAASNPQSAGNLFGQPSSGGAFGSQQSQPSLFGSQPQSGSGLFGNTTAPSGGAVFGAPQTTSNLFGGAGQQSNIFGGGAQSQQSLFGANAGAQRPLFAPAGGFSTGGFGQQSGGAGLFGSTGGGLGQSAPNTGFGGQPNMQQQSAQPSMFGAPGGQIGQNAPSTGFNPTLQNTFNAVTQGAGGTVAPPGANYGTVLHNLQMLQGGIEEQKRLLEQQAKNNANNAQHQGSLSIVVLPSPPLVKLSANRWSASQGHYGYSSRTPSRTKMRGVVGRISGAKSKVSGTPLKLPTSETKAEAQPVGTPSVPSSAVRKMPFFSPQQFTGPRRRALRSSEVTTPHKSSPFPLPIPDTGDRSGRISNVAVGSGGKSVTPKRFPLRNGGRGAEEGGDPDTSGLHTPNGTPGPSPNSAGRRPNNGSTAPADEERNGSVGGTNKKRTSGVKSSKADFMWSSPRPSAWSLGTPVDSDDQYNPDKYLPYLAREGFYTVPSMAALASRTMKELQNVENFTVGRKGYGEIRWVEPVDVRGLDLDMVIDIQRGEIAVYPDHEADQLDAPAIITLEGMYKKDKRTGTPTTDKELTRKYAMKLEGFCEKNDLRFIDYSPEDGRWTFEAPGFADQ